MSDIFLSYAREDFDQAKRLAGLLLELGWSVFWDFRILPGKDWQEELEIELNQAHCVIVLWSKQSIRSKFVRDEAREGLERNVLIPLLIEAVRPPLGFRGIQTADFIDWNGEAEAPVYQRLIKAISNHIGLPTTVKPINPPQTDSVSKNESVYPVRERRVRVKKPSLESRTPSAPFEQGNIAHTVSNVLANPVAPNNSVAPVHKPFDSYRDTLKDRSLGPEMVIVPAGSFRMGDIGGKGSADERPVHTVSFAQAFAIGRYTVTFDEYDYYAKSAGISLPDDSGWGRGRRPVINVSWQQAVAYAKWLAEQTGKPYRLPSEAEWEYAARAGTETAYWWGDGIGSNRANCNGSGSEWSGQQTAPVGSFEPNSWGLHDTVGNVWEWVQDPWHGNYEGAPSDGSVWEQGGSEPRVLRGGSWNVLLGNARASSRNYFFNPDNRYLNVGFRLACVLPHAF